VTRGKDNDHILNQINACFSTIGGFLSFGVCAFGYAASSRRQKQNSGFIELVFGVIHFFVFSRLPFFAYQAMH